MYKVLCDTLPQSLQMSNVVEYIVPTVEVRMQLEELASTMLVFSFIGRILARGELTSWLASNIVLGMAGAIDFIQYISKGFYVVKLVNPEDVKKIKAKGTLMFARTPVCILPWEPMLDSALDFKEQCPVAQLLEKFQVV